MFQALWFCKEIAQRLSILPSIVIWDPSVFKSQSAIALCKITQLPVDWNLSNKIVKIVKILVAQGY